MNHKYLTVNDLHKIHGMLLASMAFAVGLFVVSCMNRDGKAGNGMDLGKQARDTVVVFQPGKWNEADWTPVKSSRWDVCSHFVQRENWIENVVPEGATPEQLLHEKTPETYASLLWKPELEGNFTVASRMDFDYRMAPLIVLADEIGASKTGFPEFRQHWEIVLWDEGINVWHHVFDEEGKQHWTLVAYAKRPSDNLFKANTIYDLVVHVRRQAEGAILDIQCGDEHISLNAPQFPQKVRAGITACEGLNRFYDFRVTFDK